LEGVRENFYKEAEGAVVVGGANFGRGSSREHAPLAMKACRIKCIIAPSFSPIFLRNSLNIGLYTIFANIYEDVEEGEEIIVDIKRGLIKYKEKEYSFPPLPLFVQKIVECGGLLNYAKLS
jgi:3-isopropylmalate/(R)-2-methylmalate dehydratase small subunit